MGTKAPGPVTRLHFPAPCPSHHLSLPAAFSLGLLHPRFPSRSITLATRIFLSPSFPPFSEPTKLRIDPRGAFHSRSPEDSKFFFFTRAEIRYARRCRQSATARKGRSLALISEEAGRQKGGGVKGTKKNSVEGRSGKEEMGRKKWEGRNGKEEMGRKKWEGRNGKEEMGRKKFLFRLDEKFNLGSFYIAVTYLLTYGVFLDLFNGWRPCGGRHCTSMRVRGCGR
jgi:hypothetical protein